MSILLISIYYICAHIFNKAHYMSVYFLEIKKQIHIVETPAQCSLTSRAYNLTMWAQYCNLSCCIAP